MADALYVAIVHYAQAQQYHNLHSFCSEFKSDDAAVQQLCEFFSSYASLRMGHVEPALASWQDIKKNIDSGEREDNSLFALTAALIEAYQIKIASQDTPEDDDTAYLAQLKSSLKPIMKSSNPASMFLCAFYFMLSGQVSKAKSSVDRILANDKNNVHLLCLHGFINMTLDEKKTWDKANASIKRAIKIDKTDLFALYALAQYRRSRDTFPKALQAANKIVAAQKTLIPGLLTRAGLLMVSNDYSKALATTKKVLKLDSENVLGYRLLFLDSLLQHPHDSDKNVKNMKRLLKGIEKVSSDSSSPYMADLYYNAALMGLALCRQNLDVLKTVEVGFRRAVTAHSKNPAVLLQMGIHGYTLGKSDRCEKMLTKALGIIEKEQDSKIALPTDGPAYDALEVAATIHALRSRILLEAGDYSAAKSMLKSVSGDKSKKVPMTLYSRALVLRGPEYTASNRSKVATLLTQGLQLYRTRIDGDLYKTDHIAFYISMDITALDTMFKQVFECVTLPDDGESDAKTLKTEIAAAQQLVADNNALGTMVDVAVDVVTEVAGYFGRFPELELWSGKLLCLRPSTHGQAHGAFSRCADLGNKIGNKMCKLLAGYATTYNAVIHLDEDDDLDVDSVEFSDASDVLSDDDDDQNDDDGELDVLERPAKKKRERFNDDIALLAGEQAQKSKLTLADLRAKPAPPEQLAVNQSLGEEDIDTDDLSFGENVVHKRKKPSPEQKRRDNTRAAETPLHLPAVLDDGGATAFGNLAVLRKPQKRQVDSDSDDLNDSHTVQVLALGKKMPIEDDDSDLEIDNGYGFMSGKQQGRNTKDEVRRDFIRSEEQHIEKQTGIEGESAKLRVFKDSSKAEDNIGHQIFDMEEKFRIDAQRAADAKKQALIDEQRAQLEKQTAIARSFALFAEKGEVYYKHGRTGFPHARRLTVILLKDHKTVEARWGPGDSFLHLKKNDAVLLDGKQTKVFRRKVSRKAQAELCFSLANSKRTLDLEARSLNIKEKWFRGLKLLVMSLHHS